ncbi:unnamed protein product [Vitrella brassicaformis CCMP3155]|uniref:RING-type domain-containing protein n=1 Tax=Vitrella brassicaformis (strain CCMP3155) TaxID=1169540 RepID=A0A0G4ER36_VITBC|nr:unnamed protein product [Vitrella brassicaformis CCMP3155]|eukprot:CEL99944.1 unnamed protein product [Vitrella brassicaformis CCMP3155]
MPLMDLIGVARYGRCLPFPGEMSEEPGTHIVVWAPEWDPALQNADSRGLRELLEPQGCSELRIRSDDGNEPATTELAAGVACRTITSAEDVTRLCQEGADEDLGLELHLGSCHLRPVGLLSLVIIDAIIGQNTDARLTLPPWPSRELQQAVLEAFLAAGANPNGRPDEGFRPLEAAHGCGKVTAVDVLLRAGAVTHGLHLACLKDTCHIPSPPCPQYEADLLKNYHRLFEHDPAPADEEYYISDNKQTPIHVAAAHEAERGGIMSHGFICAYLALLAQHGASLTARQANGYTSLGTAVLVGAPWVAEWLCERLGKEEINKTRTDVEGVMISVLEHAGLLLSDRLRDKAAPEAVDRARQVIRTLLQHGADIRLVRKASPHQRYIRKLVQDIHNDIPKPSAPLQQQQQQQQKESDAAKAAKIAAELIRGEARDKAKKAKRGGKKGGKGSAHQQQQQREQQRPVSIEFEPIDDDEASSSVATGAVETDADEQPPSTSSADPQPAASSSSCDVSSAVPAPATSPVDGEESDGEFVPVVRGRKKNKKRDSTRPHLQPDQQEPAPTRQHAALTQTQPLNIGGGPFSSSAARRPPAGRGLFTHMPTQTRAHRGPPPLVPMAAMPPSMGSSALPPRPQQPPPPALVRPLAPSVRQGADRPAASPSTIDTNTALAHRTPVSAGGSSHAENAQGGFGTTTDGAAERLVGQLRQQLSQQDQENDALIRQLQEAEWKLAQATSASSSSGGEDDALRCDDCMDNYKSILLIPCRHICLCGGCAGVLMTRPPADRLCPRCRQPITDTQQVYL